MFNKKYIIKQVNYSKKVQSKPVQEIKKHSIKSTRISAFICSKCKEDCINSSNLKEHYLLEH